MIYIEAPKNYSGNEKSLFLAWWITGCEDWQSEFIEYFKDTSLAIINPRRKDFDITNSSLETEQITWEHEHLEKADIISFWFGKETLCPIVPYELWKYINTHKEVFIWIEPWYQRTRDVEIQAKLVRPNMIIVDNLADFSLQVKDIL